VDEGEFDNTLNFDGTATSIVSDTSVLLCVLFHRSVTLGQIIVERAVESMICFQTSDRGNSFWMTEEIGQRVG
jgi:hypothetical protein